MANDNRFALGAGVWTRDLARGHRVADRIVAGMVWVNDHHRLEPSLPWGGVKESGIGKDAGIRVVRRLHLDQDGRRAHRRRRRRLVRPGRSRPPQLSPPRGASDCVTVAVGPARHPASRPARAVDGARCRRTTKESRMTQTFPRTGRRLAHRDHQGAVAGAARHHHGLGPGRLRRQPVRPGPRPGHDRAAAEQRHRRRPGQYRPLRRPDRRPVPGRLGHRRHPVRHPGRLLRPHQGALHRHPHLRGVHRGRGVRRHLVAAGHSAVHRRPRLRRRGARSVPR